MPDCQDAERARRRKVGLANTATMHSKQALDTQEQLAAAQGVAAGIMDPANLSDTAYEQVGGAALNPGATVAPRKADSQLTPDATKAPGDELGLGSRFGLGLLTGSGFGQSQQQAPGGP